MPHLKSRPYRVVGHRGNPSDFPENTLEGVLSAIAMGVDAVEVDVQLSLDHTCMVVHDASTARTSSHSLLIAERTAAELAGVRVQEPERFGEKFSHCLLPTLQQLSLGLQDSEVQVFLELKAESLHYSSREAFAKAALDQSECLSCRRIIISFDIEILRIVRELSSLPVGWVLSDYSEYSRAEAAQFSPEYLIIDHTELPLNDQPFWPGSWQWFVYDVSCLKESERLLKRGVRYIETWQPSVFA
ncbi:glycerophosphodiester phosphodiesterase family protein [Teredinibacter haidensis]|uniref:glycerophosphodiester phosphodiesterase family protein n=1 Tax=Teredinibacter haidensis TaxID=2731755 RepID=UPI000948E5AB|nr:glycerophosphodiester phosphodiesterase family protein [Teredinibacter haidensis]